MSSQNKVERVSIFEGGHLEASLLKSLLERHGIAVFMENQSVATIAPWQVTAGGIHPVKLIISRMDQEQATRLIAKFDQAIKKNNR